MKLIVLISSLVYSENPVCIIGAGIMGLSIGRRLSKTNNVIIIEKEENIGGKAQTFKMKEDFADIGPLLISNFNKNILDLASELGVEFIKSYRDQVFLFQNDGNYTLFNQFTVPDSTPDEEKKNYASLIMKFIKVRQSINIQPGHIGHLPDLYVPFSEWLKSNGLEDLGRYLSGILTYQGYGKINEISALYHLTFFSVDRIKAMLDPKQEFNVFKLGINNFMKKIGENLEIITNAEVISATLSLRKNSLIYLKDDITHQKYCSKIISTVPLSQQYFDKIFKRDKNKFDLFKDVRLHRYMTNVFDDKGLKETYYIKKSIDLGDGSVIAIIKQKGLATTYSWKGYSKKCYDAINPEDESICNYERENPESFKEMIYKANEFMPKIKKVPAEAQLSKEWQYFPHVTIEGLKYGFFKKLDLMQGHCGLYFSSTALSFELTENALQVVNFMFDQYFSKPEFSQKNQDYGDKLKGVNSWTCQ